MQLLAPTIALFGVAAIRLLPMMNFYSEGINRLRYSRYYVSLLYNDVSKLKRYKAIKEKESTENSDLFIQNLANKTFVKRIGSPKDATSAIYFLSLDETSYVTGQNIVVDGGWTSW